MLEINWVALSPETLYYCHEKYILKKRKIKSYFVYTIWENNIMMLNTYNEYEFICVACKIINNMQFNRRGKD